MLHYRLEVWKSWLRVSTEDIKQSMNSLCRPLVGKKTMFNSHLLLNHTHAVDLNCVPSVCFYFNLTQPYTIKNKISQGSKMLDSLGAIIAVNEYLLLPLPHAQCI